MRIRRRCPSRPGRARRRGPRCSPSRPRGRWRGPPARLRASSAWTSRLSFLPRPPTPPEGPAGEGEQKQRDDGPRQDAVGGEDPFELLQVGTHHVTEGEQKRIPKARGHDAEQHHPQKVDAPHPRRHEEEPPNARNETIEEDEEVAAPPPLRLDGRDPIERD